MFLKPLQKFIQQNKGNFYTKDALYSIALCYYLKDDLKMANEYLAKVKTIGKTETDADKELVGFVLDHCTEWRDHRDVNYVIYWQEYERLFRGIWDPADKTRDTERSQLITPAIAQAVESKQAEISEAIFGRGDWL